MNNEQSRFWAPVADGAPEWMTLAFVLIGAGVLLVLFIVWRGSRLAARRRRAYDELEREGAYHQEESAADARPIPSPPLPATPAYEAPPQPAPVIAAPVHEPEPVPAPSPSTHVDELIRLKGVGPRLADRLNAVGITSFAQVAALTPDEANALDAKLGEFQGRIHRDRWIEQAKFLAVDDIAGFEEKFGKL